jgi:hypothetical protein
MDHLTVSRVYGNGYLAAESAIEAWGLVLAVRAYLQLAAWREPRCRLSEAYSKGQNDAMLYAVTSAQVGA